MNVLGVFAKHPQPGRVKTRLAADVGADTAAELYAAFLADLLDRFRTTGDRRIIGFTPADLAARRYFEMIADGYDLWPQPEGGLGDRIAAFFDHVFAAGGTRVVLIGSDSPTLPRDFVEQAFALLARHDCVLGPATDGGYYLIGLRGESGKRKAEGEQDCAVEKSPLSTQSSVLSTEDREADRWDRNASPTGQPSPTDAHRGVRPPSAFRLPPLLAGIPWGGPHVLRHTVERVAQSDWSLALTPVWYDVDDVADLQFLRGHLAALHAAGETAIAPRTAACLARDIPSPGGIR